MRKFRVSSNAILSIWEKNAVTNQEEEKLVNVGYIVRSMYLSVKKEMSYPGILASVIIKKGGIDYALLQRVPTITYYFKLHRCTD